MDASAAQGSQGHHGQEVKGWKGNLGAGTQDGGLSDGVGFGHQNQKKTRTGTGSGVATGVGLVMR